MHDFEADDDGQCLHCPLPRGNRRHNKTTPGPVADPAKVAVNRANRADPSGVTAALADLNSNKGPKARVFEVIVVASRMGVGATDDELICTPALADLGPNTVRPRRVDLEKAGLVCRALDTQGRIQRRPTKAGHPAAVWVVTEAAHAVLLRSAVAV